MLDDVGQTIILVFDRVEVDTLVKCKLGERVNLWQPPDKKSVVFAFARRSIGGQGKIGLVPQQYAPIISSHLGKNGEYETEIVTVSSGASRVDVRCRLVSAEEAAARKVETLMVAAEKLRDEFVKGYTAKKEYQKTVRVSLPKNNNLHIGQELFLEIHKQEYYLNRADRLSLWLTDYARARVVELRSHGELLRKVLRASFSGVAVKFTLSTMETPDPISLKYMETIRGEIEVLIPVGVSLGGGARCLTMTDNP